MDKDDLHYLDAILFDEHEDEDDNHDVAGILVARALNDGHVPGFIRAHDGGADDAETKFRPLFGAENRRKLKLAVVRSLCFVRKQGLGEVTRQGWLKIQSTRRKMLECCCGWWHWLPTNDNTVAATATFLFFTVALLTAPSYLFVVTAWRSLVLLAVATVALFFDLGEITGLCPDFVVQWLCQAWLLIESKLLLGKQYVGRQWVEASIGNEESGTCKKKESLTSRWNAKFGQRFGGRRLVEKEKEVMFTWLEKDTTTATRELDMTNDTVEHMAAMNFCYTMLRGVKTGRRVKVREKFRNSMKNILSLNKKEREKLMKEEKTQQILSMEEPNESSTANLEVEMTRSEFGKRARRRRRLSWPPQEDADNFCKGVSKRKVSKRNDDGLMIVSSHDDDCEGERYHDGNEGFEVTESEQRAPNGVKVTSEVRRSGLKRFYSDSDLLLNSDDESAKEHPANKSSNIFSSVSFDGIDGDDSLTTASTLSAGPEREPCSGRDEDEEKELNWIDVGAKIGIRILNSDRVQKAMANPDAREQMEKRLSKGIEKIEKAPDKLDTCMETAHSHVRTPEERATSPREFIHSVGDAPLAKEGLDQTRSSPRASNEGRESTPVKPVHAIWTSPGAAILPDSPSSTHTGMDSSASSTVESSTIEDRKSEGGLGQTKEWSWSGPPSPPSPITLWKNNEICQHHTGMSTLDASRYQVQRKDDNLRRGFSQAQTVPSLSTTPSEVKRRRIIPAGVKMAIPVCPIAPLAHVHHGKRRRISHQSGPCHYQMATVVSSRRIYVSPLEGGKFRSPQRLNGYVFPTSTMDERKMARQLRNNCLSITVQLDKSFLRDGKFAEMVIRVMDEWTEKHDMPRHSKYPIGSCVATSFGIGVLVGWRVEDDCHVIRSLWQRRGPGSALAYLNRNSLHGVVEAAIGFRVETALGYGDVVAYINGGPEFRRGKYFVAIKQRGRHLGDILEFSRPGILSCKGSNFIPIIEQIRESAKYQIQLLNYEAMQRERSLVAQGISLQGAILNGWSEGLEVIMSSFIRAAEEDQGKWLSSFISFLERLDFHGNLSTTNSELIVSDISSAASSEVVKTEETQAERSGDSRTENKPLDESTPAGLWLFDDLFGGVFSKGNSRDGNVSDISSGPQGSFENDKASFIPSSSNSYANAYVFIGTALRTVAVARASAHGRTNLQLGLGMCHEVILFIRTIIKVQERNVSPKSVKAWKRTVQGVASTFGPLKRRLYKLGSKIAERLAEQGKNAKVRVIRFVDILMLDDLFLSSLEMGQWSETITRIQLSLVRAGIVDLKTSQQYLKTAKVIYNHMAPRTKTNKDASTRNGEKLAKFALALKWLASPQRSFLSLFARDNVLVLIERLMVRVYQKDAEACNMLSLYAFNFHSFRHLRLLNNMSIAGKLWRPVLDAADEEFSWAVSRMPENAREFIEPISKLFSLGVARFRQMKANDLSADWLEFLNETQAVKIIQQLDLKLILNLESFCSDLKEMVTVLPYYSSIDDDILKLMDEVDLEKILHEATEALVDTERFAYYIREKSALAVKRFLDYLPKMSIPVERREIGEGWVLTCRDKGGGDLRLSDVSIEREYMTCNVIGSGNVFSPVDLIQEGVMSSPSWLSPSFEDDCSIEVSILNDIADLIQNAQQHGSWQPGTGGIQQFANGKSVDPALDGLAVSEVLKCGIELWKNLEIDDDELMQIAIQDVSFQIQLQKDREEGTECVLKDASIEKGRRGEGKDGRSLLHTQVSIRNLHNAQFSSQTRKRFNPRKDPTVLFLEMKKVTCMLNDFVFRVEQKAPSSVFDPVFEGLGSLKIQNLSIRLRVECRKERINKLETEVTVPVLYLQELDIQLEQVKVKFKDTGADWILNKITRGLRDNITEVVTMNVKEEIGEQIQVALEHLNSYIEVNPDLMLTILGITIDDLEENVIWV